MTNNRKPLIGITSRLIRKRNGSLVCQVGQAYVNSIQKAGGIPLVIPVGMETSALNSLLSRLDGVMFTGGADIEPKRFNAQSHPRVYGVSRARDTLEFSLIDKVLEGEMPMLAICRGIHERYHPARHNPFNEVECGDHYARALASWGVYHALLGYDYHGPRQHIGFAPKLSQDNFAAAFTAAEGWGLFRQKRTADRQENRIQIRHGRLEINGIVCCEILKEDLKAGCSGRENS